MKRYDWSSTIMVVGACLAVVLFIERPHITLRGPEAAEAQQVDAMPTASPLWKSVDPSQPNAIPAGMQSEEELAKLPEMAGLTPEQVGKAVQPAVGSVPTTPQGVLAEPKGVWVATGFCQGRNIDAALMQMAFDPNVAGGGGPDQPKMPVTIPGIDAVASANMIGQGTFKLAGYTVSVLPDGQGSGDIRVLGPEGSDTLRRDMLCCAIEQTGICKERAGVWQQVAGEWRYVDTSFDGWFQDVAVEDAAPLRENQPDTRSVGGQGN